MEILIRNEKIVANSVCYSIIASLNTMAINKSVLNLSYNPVSTTFPLNCARWFWKMYNLTRGFLNVFLFSFRVRLYINVPGSLIIAGNSKKPIRKPPSSTNVEQPSIEITTAQDAETEAGKMTQSGAMSM